MAGNTPKLIFEPYYQQVTGAEQKTYPRGSFYWCPCLYFHNQIRLLNLHYSDPYDKNPALFVLGSVDRDSFQARTHKPIVKPELQADEEMLVFKAWAAMV